MLKSIVKKAIRCYVSNWKPYSRLFVVAEAGWSISHDMMELARICKVLDIKVPSQRLAPFSSKQCVFLGSHFDLLLSNNKWLETSNRLATAYFHGRPGDGVEEFDICFERLKANHHKISRIQVSYSEMKNVILESGINPEKVFQIPIGINLNYFSLQTPTSKAKIRKQLGIPELATVIGSFQKDGQGWGDGLEPKLIKGPDVFLKTIEILMQSVPDLFVLLSGPARGYMKSGLDRLKIPYLHVYQKSYPEIGKMFQALDLYIVSSREEGGPKAILESMASGVPLVTTRVGQAMDLVKHARNGWMVESGEAESLAYWAEYALQNEEETNAMICNGRKTAEANSYLSQIPLWEKFMNGFF